MQEFERFKKRIWRQHCVKAAFITLTSGLIGAAFAILLCHLLWPVATIPVAILSGLVFAGLGFFLFYKKAFPSDKQIALRLDRDLKLHEKTATMIEFQGHDNVLLQKQRQDAQQWLSTQPTQALKLRVSVVGVVALALAVGGFTGSFFVPQRNPQIVDSPVLVSSSSDTSDLLDSNDDEPITSTEDPSSAAAESEDNLSSQLQDILNSLQQELNGQESAEERKSAGESAKEQIDQVVDDANTKDEIGNALKNQEDQALQDLGQALLDGNNDAVNDAMNELSDELNEAQTPEELAEKMQDVANQIRNALEEAEENGANPEDSLYQALEELADELSEQAEQLQQGTEPGEEPGEADPSQSGRSGESGDQEAMQQAQESADEAIDEAQKQIMSEVMQQNANEQAGEEAKQQVDQMVQGQGQGEEQGQGQGQSQGEGENGNGAGSGSFTERHTDTIYTKDGSTEYGDVINDYQADAATDAEAADDEDVIDIQGEYFNNLYGENN